MFPILVTVLVLIAGGLGYYTFKDTIIYQIRAQIRRRTPQPTPTPRPIAHGKQSFTASNGSRLGPQFTGGTLDPYDPVKDSKQIISVQINSTSPVQSLYGIVASDHARTTVRFTRVSGTDTSGTWQGEWIASDSYLYTYELNIYANSADGSNKLEMSLR